MNPLPALAAVRPDSFPGIHALLDAQPGPDIVSIVRIDRDRCDIDQMPLQVIHGVHESPITVPERRRIREGEGIILGKGIVGQDLPVCGIERIRGIAALQDAAATSATAAGAGIGLQHEHA